ncbi:MAG: TIGR02757 family protein [Candidatus Eisenbacteria bacterium]|nr:TIGR02757 family protein [Candidatus Eisenbacteria bacterium]
MAAIRRHVEEVLALMGGSPARFVRRFDRRRDGRAFLALRYRFHTGADLAFLLEALGDVYRSHRSLEEVFLEGGEETRDRLGALVGRIRLSLRGGGADLRSSYGLRFLLASPEKGGACKRWNLFLRWMVRPDDGIDCGVWRSVDPAELIAPLDAHLHRIGRRLGLVSSRAANWAAAESLTASLRAVDPHDPLRFDFPLCRLGILDRCPGSGFVARCGRCELFSLCDRVLGSGPLKSGKKMFDTMYEKS